MSEWTEFTCARCNQAYFGKFNSDGLAPAHSEQQCIEMLKEALRTQENRARRYATKYFELLTEELAHDLDEGIITKEDLEPYISQIASLLKRGA